MSEKRVVPHGDRPFSECKDDYSEVHSAWSEEIARRVRKIESGRVKTIPAEEAERMIFGNLEPNQ